MIYIIVGIVLLIMSISLFVSYNSSSKPRKNVLMGITLPYEYIEHSKVLSIVKQFKRKNLMLFVIFLIISPLVFAIRQTSFVILFIAVWYAVYMIAVNGNFKEYNMRLILLKSKNDWFPSDAGSHKLEPVTELIGFRRLLPASLRKRFPTVREQILAQAKEPVYVDDDEYWMEGNYRNPEDKRTVVEKRIGFGTTCNMATKKGRHTVYGVAAFTILILGGVFLLTLWMDLATFEMLIKSDTVEVKAPLYGYEFNLEDIKEVSLLEAMPEHGVRTNGTATGTYYLGNFNFDDYGRSKAYVYLDYPPFIAIEVNDLTVFFNWKSEEDTREIYERLRKAIE